MQQREFQTRANHRIRVPEVLVIDSSGASLGVLPTHEAVRRAQSQGLDLVEVNPRANPPVCKILDFGKYKYEEKKKAGEAKRKQTVVEIKEIKLRPKTDDHDVAFKTKDAREFLESGNKVKLTIRFRGREMAHPDEGKKVLEEIIPQLMDVGSLELAPRMEGRTMCALVSPKSSVLQKVSQEKVQRERERQERKNRERSEANQD